MKNLWRISGRLIFWACWPLLFFRLSPRPRTRVLIISDDDLLLVKGWISDGKWGLPGGGLHYGETIHMGAKREVFEETGVKLNQNQLVHRGLIKTKKYGLNFTYEVFTANLARKPPIRPQRFEITDIAWIKIGGVPDEDLSEAAKLALANWKQAA